jgi:hypothetical protein
MGKLIEGDFSQRRGLNKNDQELDAKVIRAFASFHENEETIEKIKTETLGNELTGESNCSKIKNFFFSLFAVRLGKIKENLELYLYTSSLLAQPNFEFTRVIDILLKGENLLTKGRYIGDTCFRLATIFRDYIERKPPMSVKDYIEIGRTHYYSHGRLTRKQLYINLAEAFDDLAEVAYQGIKTIIR